MQIYLLKAIERVSSKNCNGSCRDRELDLGLFDTKDKAEEAMRQAIRELQWPRLFAFLIYEREMNHPCLTDDGCLSITTYLADGTLFCHSLCDSSCEKRFKGRPGESIKFKQGDLAWFWGSGRIAPCLVDIPPNSEERYAAYCHEHGHSPDDPHFYNLDYSDDCYLVYCYDNNHYHPQCWYLFPFNDTITKRNMDRLLATKKWWEDGCP